MSHAYVYLNDQGSPWKGREGYWTPASFSLTSLICKWKILGIMRKRREDSISRREHTGAWQEGGLGGDRPEPFSLRRSELSPWKGHLETGQGLEKTKTSDRADLGGREK